MPNTKSVSKRIFYTAVLDEKSEKIGLYKSRKKRSSSTRCYATWLRYRRLTNGEVVLTDSFCQAGRVPASLSVVAWLLFGERAWYKVVFWFWNNICGRKNDFPCCFHVNHSDFGYVSSLRDTKCLIGKQLLNCVLFMFYVLVHFDAVAYWNFYLVRWCSYVFSFVPLKPSQLAVPSYIQVLSSFWRERNWPARKSVIIVHELISRLSI